MEQYDHRHRQQQRHFERRCWFQQHGDHHWRRQLGLWASNFVNIRSEGLLPISDTGTTVVGNENAALIYGVGSNRSITIIGDNNEASSMYGDNNNATVIGNDSSATAGGYAYVKDPDEITDPFDAWVVVRSHDNTATVNGDGLTAIATDGHTVVVP